MASRISARPQYRARCRADAPGPAAQRLLDDAQEQLARQRRHELGRSFIYHMLPTTLLMRGQIARVRETEQSRTPGREALARAAADAYAKLLAYKDEYEVARLYSEPAFLDSLRVLNVEPTILNRRVKSAPRWTSLFAPPISPITTSAPSVARQRRFRSR